LPWPISISSAASCSRLRRGARCDPNQEKRKCLRPPPREPTTRAPRFGKVLEQAGRRFEGRIFLNTDARTAGVKPARTLLTNISARHSYWPTMIASGWTPDEDRLRLNSSSPFRDSPSGRCADYFSEQQVYDIVSSRACSISSIALRTRSESSWTHPSSDSRKPPRRRGIVATGEITLPPKYGPDGHFYQLGLLEDGERHLVMHQPAMLR
jgi:hypothetical protein